MSELRTEESDATLQIPSMTVRSFLLGMLAMNVLIGLIFILFLCFVPLLLLIVVGVLDSSIFKQYILFVLALVVGISLAINVIQIGIWCFRGLFSSLTQRVVVTTILLAWNVLLAWVAMANYVDVAIVVGVLGFAVWDLFIRRLEMS